MLTNQLNPVLLRKNIKKVDKNVDVSTNSTVNVAKVIKNSNKWLTRQQFNCKIPKVSKIDG